MIYNVTHRTTFKYSQSVSISHHLLHMAPRPCPQQICQRYSLIVEPPPTIIKHDIDYFGNPITYLTVEVPHAELDIFATSTVNVSPRPAPTAAATAPWDKIFPMLAASSERTLLDVYQFAFDSPFTGNGSGGAYAYGRQSFPPGRPILDGAIELMGRIFQDFKYMGGVTDIYTPVDQVLAQRSGVCQDFAHLHISCMRSLGLPARYVSGYLLTKPPPGQPKLVGADASHAWLSVWVPDHGWVDLDPTNNLLPGEEHITVGWGRDYGDVSPINGLVVGGGQQIVAVSVDVAPVG